MAEKIRNHPFIDHLIALSDDRGSLAALRRGLGQPPGAAPEMFPQVVPWLPVSCSAWAELVYYLAATLFAFHSSNIPTGNMGAHLRATIKDDNGEKATERRFVALLNSHPDDLGVHLRHAVSYLKSKDQPVCWAQLFDDLMHWDHPARFVQRNWANSFWGRGSQKPEESENAAKTAAVNE